jgi:hypothetical protein
MEGRPWCPFPNDCPWRYTWWGTDIKSVGALVVMADVMKIYLKNCALGHQVSAYISGLSVFWHLGCWNGWEIFGKFVYPNHSLYMLYIHSEEPWKQNAMFYGVCWLIAVVKMFKAFKHFLSVEGFFLLPMPPNVLYGLRGLPSQLWLKCNWLLWLGRPCVVTLSWWSGWW